MMKPQLDRMENARLTKQVQALLVVHTERDALVNQRDAKAENHGQDAHVDEQEANETAGQHTEQHAENQNANTAKVQGQRDVTADDTAGTSGSRWRYPYGQREGCSSGPAQSRRT